MNINLNILFNDGNGGFSENPITNIDSSSINPKILNSDIIDMEAYFLSQFSHNNNIKFSSLKWEILIL